MAGGKAFVAQESFEPEDASFSLLKKRNQEPLALNAPWSHPPNLLITSVLKSQESILRPKCSFGLKTSKKFLCLGVTQSETVWQEVPLLWWCHRKEVLQLRSQKEISIPRDFSQAKEACFYFKISACFPKPPAKFSGWILALKHPQKCSVWVFWRPNPFSRMEKMLQWGLEAPLESSDHGCKDTQCSPAPTAGALCPFQEHIWALLACSTCSGMQRELAGSQPRASSLTGREKSNALGHSLLPSHLGSIFSQTFSLKAFSSSSFCPPFTCWVPTIPLWISLQC